LNSFLLNLKKEDLPLVTEGDSVTAPQFGAVT